MIDFVKCRVHNTSAMRLLSNNELPFRTNIDTDTGEVINHIAECEGLKFKIFTSGYTELSGSIHKYFNSGFQNYSQFSYKQICQVLNNIESRFEIKPEHCDLVNLEFGLNIQTDTIDVSSLLDNVLTLGNKPFMNVFNTSQYTKKVVLKEYELKAYDKGLQYNLNENIFRYEKKYKRSKLINNCGILNLSHLQDHSVYKTLYNDLVKSWKRTLVYEPPNEGDSYSKIKLNQWQNIIYWKNMDKLKRHREKTKFFKYRNENTKNIHSQILKMLDNTFNNLIK